MFFNNDWDIALHSELTSYRFKLLLDFLRSEYKKAVVYPPKDKVFRCFKLTPYNDLKVVILGQDPYHEAGQANGLCFSVDECQNKPPSLVNIFKELQEDLGEKINLTSDLTFWAKQGVLLLNSVMSVREGAAGSHSNKGWEWFTDSVISAINYKTEPVVFILWGNYARNKSRLITNPEHYIIESAHPSPLSASRGFFGSKPFSKCNEYLKATKREIIWNPSIFNEEDLAKT